jgi:hypothetical protein
MKMPGFSAEASLYQTNRDYMLYSVETGQNVVVPSLPPRDCDYLDMLCDYTGGTGDVCKVRDKYCGPRPRFEWW